MLTAPLTPIQAVRYTRPVLTPRCDRVLRRRLTTLYAQSRPAMLSRRCLTATAGTSLVRDSEGARSASYPPAWRMDYAWRKDACSGFHPVTKIPHCCRWWEYLPSQVAGRPHSPARDRWLSLTPNPARAHPTAATAFAPYVRGAVGQHLAYYAPLGRYGTPLVAVARLACVRRLARIRPEL